MPKIEAEVAPTPAHSTTTHTRAHILSRHDKAKNCSGHCGAFPAAIATPWKGNKTKKNITSNIPKTTTTLRYVSEGGASGSMWLEFEFECRWWRDSGGVVGPRKCTLNTLSAESAVLEPSEPLPTINGRRYQLTSPSCMSLYCCCARCTLYVVLVTVCEVRVQGVPGLGPLDLDLPHRVVQLWDECIFVSFSMWSLGWTYLYQK